MAVDKSDTTEVVGPLDFSICVATYGRPQLLAALAERVASQVGASFEIIVVDDGSPDDTVEVLERLATKLTVPFQWASIPHAGRGAALNRAFELARGRFIFLLDDDDTIPEGALADIVATWEGIPKAERAEFCGVAGLAARPDGKIIGQQFPSDPLDDDFFSARFVGGVRGDKREVLLRSALGDWRFPVVQGEYRVATNLLWFHLASRYRMRFVNRVWLIKTYRPDGLSANGLRNKVESAQLTAHYNKEALRLFPSMPLLLKLRFTLDYMRFAAHAGVPPAERRGVLKGSPLAGIMAWIGEASARRDRQRLQSGRR
jgi:glycosyltransferase involved in cell wall biosynthesis